MTVRFYSSLDTGAPALTGARPYDKFKQILMACLVDGYDVKPGAGWTLAHDHADGFTLSNGDGFVCYAQNTSVNTVTAYLMESITNDTTAVPSGDNRRSGPWAEGDSTTLRHHLYWQSHSVSNYRHWAVVADDKTAIISIGSNFSGVESNVTGTTIQHYVGNYLNASGLPSFCALGGSTSTSGACLLFETSVGTLLRHPLTGVADQGLTPMYSGGAVAMGYGDAQNVKIGCVLDKFTPVRLGLIGYGAGVSGSTAVSSFIYCGRLRGLVSDPYLAQVRAGTVFPVLGAGTTWDERAKLITLPDASQVLPFYGLITEVGAFVSMSPQDWV